MSGYRYQRGDGGGYFPIASDDILNILGFIPKSPTGATVNVAAFDTRTTAAATIVASNVTSLQTAGYTTVGDFGAARYKKAGGSTLGGFQSADGQWWGIADYSVTPQAFGAVPGSDCTTAIQNGIDYLNGSFASGVLFFPPGTYITSSQITIKGGVRLIGSGRFGTTIGNGGVDQTVLFFDSSTSYALLEGLFITGYLNAAAVNNTVTVNTNNPVVIRDCSIWGGSAALFNKGVDGYIENCFISGYTYNVLSSGANWYVRCKLDVAVGTPTAAFSQGTSSTGGSAENHFVQCDFSGAVTNSVSINDAALSTAITTFEGCVFSSAITITNAKVSMFSACEFGSSSFTVGTNPTCITGCASVSGSITVSGSGKILAGNYNIS